MKDPFTASIVQRIQESGLCYHAIANKAGVGYRTLKNWESGRNSATRYLGQCVLDSVDILLSEVDRNASK